MAQLTANAHKTVGPLFSNKSEIVKLTYEFAEDGGATSNTYVLGTVSGACACIRSWVHVETAATSSGSATLKIGINGGDDDAFLDVTSGAVASLTDDALASETAGQLLHMADGAKIEAVIGTAALTAGKVNLFLEVMKMP